MLERNELIRMTLNDLIEKSNAKIFVELNAMFGISSPFLRKEFKRIVINDEDKETITSLKKLRDTEPKLLGCVFYNLNYKEVIDIYDDPDVLFYFNTPEYVTPDMISIIKNIKSKTILRDINSEYLDLELGKEFNKTTDNYFTMYYNF